MDTPPPPVPPPGVHAKGGFVPPPGLGSPAKDAPAAQRDMAGANMPGRGLQGLADYAFQAPQADYIAEMPWNGPPLMGKGAAGYGSNRAMPVNPSRAPGAHLAPQPPVMPSSGKGTAAAQSALQSLQMFQAPEAVGGGDETTERQRAAAAALSKSGMVAGVMGGNLQAGNEQQRAAAENAAKENARRLKDSPLVQQLSQRNANPAKGKEEQRYKGVLKVFRPEHGWGFIENTELRNKFGYDVFLNQAVEGGIKLGSLVSFTVEMSKDGKPQARNARMEAEKADKPQGATQGQLVTQDGMVGKVFKGRVKSFNVTNGFGFLTCEEVKDAFGRDVYVNHTQVPGGGPLISGQEYEFRLYMNKQRHPQGRELKSLHKPEDYSGLGELPTAQSVGEKLLVG